MAFPTTSLLDDFNRANEEPISTNWTTPSYTGDSTGPDNWANQADFRPGIAHYDVSSFGPDCEAWVTAATAPPSGSILVCARMQNVGSANTSATYYYVQATPDRISIGKRVNGSYTVLNDSFSTVVASGDAVGIAVIGDEIQAWHKPSAGSWTMIDSVTDSDISAAGYIGVASNDGGCNLDDFGGGNVVVGLQRKRLVGPAHLTGTAATLYTTPAATRTVIRHIHVSNPSGSPVDFSLSIGPDAADTRLWDDYRIPADDIYTDNRKRALEAGDTIQAFADTPSTLVLIISGYEEPA